MMKFSLKPTTLKLPDGSMMGYLELAKSVVNHVDQKNGVNAESMATRIAILSALKEAELGEDGIPLVELETAEGNAFKGFVKAMPWGMVHEDILAFTTDVAALKEEPKKKAGTEEAKAKK